MTPRPPSMKAPAPGPSVVAADPATRPSSSPGAPGAHGERAIDLIDPVAAEIQEGELLAAVDLGSNSFHLIVARYEHGALRIIDRLREPVRIGMGLRADGSLDGDRRDGALAALSRFGQRLRTFPHRRVRAVATNTVRRLARPQVFLMLAETALGHPIEIVSGREEARLVYLGVARGLSRNTQQRLVMDIGGGSTEFIIGQGYEARETESVQMGCIASTLRFFEDGIVTAKKWQQAQTAMAIELQPFATRYRNLGWGEAIGSSGTAKAIASVVQANHWCDQGISAGALKRFCDTLITAGSITNLAELPGLSDERRTVIAGGVAIMKAAFDTFGLQHMTVCETTMREGLLHDLIGRALQVDPRAASIAALAQRYGVDTEQAGRVNRAALRLFDELAVAWGLGVPERDLLGWAADIHELGLAIAHSQHHLHGAYVVGHSDLAGFSRQEQQLLAALVRSHRRKPNRESFDALPERMRTTARHLTALLRLAVLLERGRSSEPLPPLYVDAPERSLRLQLPRTWLDQHPLTRADLDQERPYFRHLDLKLQVGELHVLAA